MRLWSLDIIRQGPTPSTPSSGCKGGNASKSGRRIRAVIELSSLMHTARHANGISTTDHFLQQGPLAQCHGSFALAPPAAWPEAEDPAIQGAGKWRLCCGCLSDRVTASQHEPGRLSKPASYHELGADNGWLHGST